MTAHLRCRHDLTLDVAVMVNAQQEQLDTIEADVQGANVAVQKGIGELGKAKACVPLPLPAIKICNTYM